MEQQQLSVPPYAPTMDQVHTSVGTLFLRCAQLEEELRKSIAEIQRLNAKNAELEDELQHHN